MADFSVLIVDGNEAFRSELGRVLCDEFVFAQVSQAQSEGEALHKVQTLRPDLVFIDIRLPGEGGLSLTQRVKTACDGIEVVVITSYDLPEYRDAAFAGGANFVLPRSCTRQEIVDVVNGMLASRSVS